MAAATPEINLREEVTCSICLCYFEDPVITECGHNFCRACIGEYWLGIYTSASCPECRQTSPMKRLTPNRQLANIVENVKQLELRPPKPQEQHLCPKHQEPLKLYCEDHQVAICVVCGKSRDHAEHAVVPIEEAAEVYKDALQIRLEQLKKDLEKMQGWATQERKTASELEEQFASQRERITDAFEEMKQLLEQSKEYLLKSLNLEQKETLMKIQGNLARLEEQQSTLQNLIAVLEGKCQQDEVEITKERSPATSRICHVACPRDRRREFKSDNTKVLKPRDDSVEMTRNVQSFSFLHAYLQERIKEFKDEFPTELVKRRLKAFQNSVTLDPDTASRWLILSQDCRNANGTETEQKVPDSPKRFTDHPGVLGSEGFTSGRHYWEVQIRHEGAGWCVGLMEGPVDRKGWLTLSPAEGVWAVRKEEDEYHALTYPPTNLSLCECPQMLGVYLDYERGQLSLMDMPTNVPLYTFRDSSFKNKVFPFFFLSPGAELMLV